MYVTGSHGRGAYQERMGGAASGHGVSQITGAVQPGMVGPTFTALVAVPVSSKSTTTRIKTAADFVATLGSFVHTEHLQRPQEGVWEPPKNMGAIWVARALGIVMIIL